MKDFKKDMENPRYNYFLKISGKVNIPCPMAIGHNYKLVADCSVVNEMKCDNENGEFDIIYKLVPITAEISKDNGETIKAKDPRRNSEKLRKYLWKVWSDSEWCLLPFDDVYTATTNEVMSIMPVILKDAVKRLNQ
jgi:hypothetical protein